ANEENHGSRDQQRPDHVAVELLHSPLGIRLLGRMDGSNSVRSFNSLRPTAFPLAAGVRGRTEPRQFLSFHSTGQQHSLNSIVLVVHLIRMHSSIECRRSVAKTPDKYTGNEYTEIG
ncbi:hypothetical protein PFISCL1PPCAC_4654, partial [Pristionchus fissidentatus]